MKFAETAKARVAREIFLTDWKRRHASDPPALYPARPGDPLYEEAEQLSYIAWNQAPDDQQEHAALSASLTQPQWTATMTGCFCPNNHFVPLDSSYCAECGAGPVPPLVKSEAQRNTESLNNRASLAWLRSFGPR